MSVSPVSGILRTPKDLSSSSRRARPENTLSSVPLTLAYTAMNSTGRGKSMGSNFTGADSSHSVSPVLVFESLETAPISPAVSSDTGSCFLPFKRYMAFMRSVWPVVALSTVMPVFNTPRHTLK